MIFRSYSQTYKPFEIFKRVFVIKKSIAVLLGCITSHVFAQGVILNQADLRYDLMWLNQQGVIQLSTSTWPLSGDAVINALSEAKIANTTQQKVVDSVLQQLKRENSAYKAILKAESNEKYLPQAFADRKTAQQQVSVEWNGGAENWDAKIRFNAERKLNIENAHDYNVEGSYIAAKLANQWLIAGQIPTWWGDSYDGSLIRGDASRPVIGLTMQRAEQNAFATKWLSWLGEWQYQAFVGQLKDYQAIPDTKLLGLRVTMQPLPYLELGGSRVLQWGGEGRSESLSTLWDAIKGNDNFDYAELDKSNQIAGLDFKLNFNPLLDVPAAVYGQYVGEDEAGMLPSKKMYLAGTSFANDYKGMPYQIYVEWADTRTNGHVEGISYSHRVYADGYYQQGHPLAHAMGGDGQMYSLGGNINIDSMNRFSARVFSAKVNQSNLTINHMFPQEDKIKAIDATWTHYIQPDMPLKVNGWFSDSTQHKKDKGIAVSLELSEFFKRLK